MQLVKLGMTDVPRALASITVLLAIMLIAACGGSDASPSGSSGSGTQPPPAAQATDITTYKFDIARSGQNTTESILTWANVNSSSFGLLRFLPTDGKVDAQPLYLAGLTIGGVAHDVMFAATENDSVYAFDANNGTVLWHVSVLGEGETPASTGSCSHVTPQIGVTATPVIDRSAGAHGILYAVAKSTSASGATYQRLHALDVTSGAELLNGPTIIAGTFPNSGGMLTFDASGNAERAALLLSQGRIYLSFTQLCDVQPYTGWIMAYDQNTLAQTAVFNAAPNSGQAGPAIWMSGGGPAADSEGNVYLLTANGGFEATLTASLFPDMGDYGNSFLKLSGTTLAVLDYFTMSNELAESAADEDLGSGGILLLPDLTDAANSTQHLAVGAGKDSNLYVVSRDALGKFHPDANDIYQEIDAALPHGIWSTPAYFNQTLYYGPVGEPIIAFSISGAKLAATSMTSVAFGYPGTAPSVSANGTNNAILWAHENSNPAVLHAFNATDLSHELYNSAQAANGRDQFGAGNKYITPVVADGKVFVGATNGVAVFGLLSK